jgi:uncharacterized membrane protein
MKRATWLPVTIMAFAFAAVFMALADLHTLFRAAIVFAFLLFCPGMAFVGLLGLDDRLTELILAIALSLTLDTLTAMVMLYIGVWSPLGGLMALAGQSVVGSTLQVALASRARVGGTP